MVAHLTGADPSWVVGAGGVWVAFRLAHFGGYLADVPAIRTGAFGVANLALVVLLAHAAGWA